MTAQHAGLRRSVATVAVVSAVAVGVWAIWDWETAPIPPVADGQTATAEPSRARFVSADGPSQQRAAVHLPPAIDATTAEVRAPSGETDSTKEVQRRFRFMFERSCELVAAEFPNAPLPQFREPQPHIAKAFCDSYLRIVKDLEIATDAYQDELTNQVTATNLSKWERPIPKGERPLDFRDAVLAGKHALVKLPPGAHLCVMSATYLIVPADASQLLDYLRDNQLGIQAAVALELLELILRLP